MTVIVVIIATIVTTKYRECPPKRDAAVLYSEARGIISALNEKGIDMAIASCSSADNTVKSLLENFGVQSMFVIKVNLFLNFLVVFPVLSR
jgi:phosphoserine phosphatase